MDVIIGGSGITGLTAGATLAKAGHKVNIFEQFHCPGIVFNVLPAANEVAKLVQAEA